MIVGSPEWLQMWADKMLERAEKFSRYAEQSPADEQLMWYSLLLRELWLERL